MKKNMLLLATICIAFTNADGQLKIVQQPAKPLSIKTEETAKTKTLADRIVPPGTFAETTPLTNAPADASKNSVRLFFNTAPNAATDDPNTKYYFFDALKDGKDKLLVFTVPNNNSLIKIDKDNTGTVKQTGGYLIDPDIKYTDELLTGNFSEEWGASIVVVDRRSNQFWRYRHNSTNPVYFDNPYIMLSNWAPADRYLTGDFNGDGKTDLLGWNFSRNEFQVAVYSKSVTPGMPPVFQPAGVWLAGWAQTADMNIVTGDFNGDKKDDIALVHQSTGEWRVALSTGTAFQSSTGYKSGVWLKPWAVGTNHKIVAMDVNNDGKCDLVEYNYSDKSFQAILSNGQYFDYCFKREYIGSTFPNVKQVAIGKYDGNCIIVVGHVLPADAYYTYARPAGSFYLTSYKR